MTLILMRNPSWISHKELFLNLQRFGYKPTLQRLFLLQKKRKSDNPLQINTTKEIYQQELGK